MDTIRLKARAKINLGLDVVRRREDGYHEVKMVMQMLRLYDQIDIEKTETPGIRLTCNLSFLPTDERNIAYKAAKVMMEQFDIKQGVCIHIEPDAIDLNHCHSSLFKTLRYKIGFPRWPQIPLSL